MEVDDVAGKVRKAVRMIKSVMNGKEDLRL